MSDVYTQQYLFLAVLLIVGVVFGIIPLLIARKVAPKKPGDTKESAYECGLVSTGEPWAQIQSQYYIYALLFVIFDVEVVFLFPWALVWKGFGAVAIAEMALFLGILGVGLAYAWKKGVLEWK